MSDVGVLHPVRIRLVQVLALGPRTGTELRRALPDVPYSSLYRHIRWLTDAGLASVVGERKIRGAVEHTYQLNRDAVQAALPDPKGLSAADHEQAATAFLTGLLAQVHAYLAGGSDDPVADGLTYITASLWVDEEELARIRAGLRDLIDPLMNNDPASDKRQLTLGVVAVPQPRPTSGAHPDSSPDRYDQRA